MSQDYFYLPNDINLIFSKIMNISDEQKEDRTEDLQKLEF